MFRQLHKRVVSALLLLVFVNILPLPSFADVPSKIISSSHREFYPDFYTYDIYYEVPYSGYSDAYTWATSNGITSQQLGLWPGTRMTTTVEINGKKYLALGFSPCEVRSTHPSGIKFGNNTDDLAFVSNNLYSKDGESRLPLPTFEFEGGTYVIFDKDRVYLTKQSEATGDYVLPATVYNDETPYKIAVIGKNAFAGSSITSISIPESVAIISEYAFYNCSQLSKINIPNTIKAIGTGAFFGCSNLSEFIVEDGDDALQLYSNSLPSKIEKVYLGRNWDYLNYKEEINETSAFNYVTDITLGNKVTRLNAYSFCKSNIKSIIIPPTVKSIDNSAFKDCDKYLKIAYPSSITPNPFNLVLAISYPEDAVIENGTVYSADKKTLYYVSTLYSGDLELPASINYIGKYACAYCEQINTIKVNSETPPEIFENSFEGIFNTANLIVPHQSKLAYLNTLWYLFKNFCGEKGTEFTQDLLTYRTISKTEAILLKGTDSSTITVPTRVVFNESFYNITGIAYGAFKDCSNLTTITLPKNLANIGDYAFDGCYLLSSTTIPETVKEIGEYAFNNCRSLSSVTIPKSTNSIGAHAFQNCTALTSISVPDAVTSIGEKTFSNCSSLASISIPNSVTSIGKEAFYGCSSLTSISIPNAVTSIKEMTFSGCTSLVSVSFSNALTSIDDRAFSGCSSLTTISIPNSVTSIGDRAFSDCSSLTTISIPNSVNSIGDRAFSDCSSLASVSLSNALSSIGDNAFSRCSSLTTISIPNSVTSIGDRAFSDCSSLASVSLSNALSSIGAYTFNQCSALTSLSIPATVTSIREYAFRSCSKLKSITLPDATISLGSYVFADCNSLSEVKLGKSLSSVGEYAFSNCSNLNSINIPDSVKTVGQYAFSNCSALSKLNFGKSVYSLGTSNGTAEVPAFSRSLFDTCPNLETITVSEDNRQ